MQGPGTINLCSTVGAHWEVREVNGDPLQVQLAWGEGGLPDASCLAVEYEDVGYLRIILCNAV